MPFLDIVKKVKEKNLDKICMIRLGNFYVAFGHDACYLREYTGLVKTCFAPNMCKVGIPVASLEKYLSNLEFKKISYCVYDYVEDDVYEYEYNNKLYSKTKECVIDKINTIDYTWNCNNCEHKESQMFKKIESIERMIMDLRIEIKRYYAIKGMVGEGASKTSNLLDLLDLQDEVKELWD